MPKLYTVLEFANIVRRSKKTVYRWIDEGKTFLDGELKYVKDGYLITEEAVERILTTKKVKQ